MITRFSSRRKPLDRSFLTERLQGARRYDRIAGFFSSSILEVAGEALESIEGPVRLVCNSALDPQDVLTAQKAAQASLRREWCDFQPERLAESGRDRFGRLYTFLAGSKLTVRVLPDPVFGLIHGKAGVINLADGRQIAFLGSVNESLTAWRLNYELLWEDDTPEAVAWVQEEFDALWGSPYAVDLAEFIVQDIERLSRREVLRRIEDWREQPEPAAPIVEAPVYRKEIGLWEHQKYFVKLAFDAHRSPHGARLVLADQVRLGKTRLIKALEANQEQDPKFAIVQRQLADEGWLDLGCIVFSQYFDSIWWLAHQLTHDLPDEEIGVYAGARKSGTMHRGLFTKVPREELKQRVRKGELRVLLGTDAASEGLNLQRLGTLINLDLPWNPSRLEQRKGRIQRIGQRRDTVDIYNMRYAGSVEDRVHDLLSRRLEHISTLFGQLPDILEDVWIDVALGEIEKARQTIDAVPRQHPFRLRYHNVRKVDWESCVRVLDAEERKRLLTQGWLEERKAHVPSSKRS